MIEIEQIKRPKIRKYGCKVRTKTFISKNIKKWCYQNLDLGSWEYRINHWSGWRDSLVVDVRFYFDNQHDLMAFKLMWAGEQS